MLYQLRDGCCCATVLVQAPADVVAGLFGKSVELKKADSAAGNEMTVVSLAETDWCMVYVYPNDDYDDEEDDIDSDPLLRQALAAIEGKIPDGYISFTASVTVAAHISQHLNCRSIGIWGSDQGDGIGGGALIDAGKLTQCYSAASHEILQKIITVRKMDDEGDEVDDLLDEIEESCEGSYWVYENGRTIRQQGEIDDKFGIFLKDLGLDEEKCCEYYHSLIMGRVENDSSWGVPQIEKR